MVLDLGDPSTVFLVKNYSGTSAWESIAILTMIKFPHFHPMAPQTPRKILSSPCLFPFAPFDYLCPICGQY